MPVYALSASSFAAYILDFRVNTNAWSLGIALWIFGYQQFMTIITMMLTGDLVYKHHIRIKKKKRLSICGNRYLFVIPMSTQRLFVLTRKLIEW